MLCSLKLDLINALHGYNVVLKTVISLFELKHFIINKKKKKKTVFFVSTQYILVQFASCQRN